MTRRWGVTALLVGAGSLLGMLTEARETPDAGAVAARPGAAAEAARALVDQLEAQAETQRAALRTTENLLARARSVLALVEQAESGESGRAARPPQPTGALLERLQTDEQEILNRMYELRRASRDPLSDPEWHALQRRLARLRETLGRRGESPPASAPPRDRPRGGPPLSPPPENEGPPEE